MNNRLEIIQNIVRERKIRSQDELTLLLAAHGIKTTQATLSRDFKKLGITKRRDARGGSYYTLPEPELVLRVVSLNIALTRRRLHVPVTWTT